MANGNGSNGGGVVEIPRGGPKVPLAEGHLLAHSMLADMLPPVVRKVEELEHRFDELDERVDRLDRFHARFIAENNNLRDPSFTGTITLDCEVPTGETLIVGVGVWLITAGVNPTEIVDSQGNTYTFVVGELSGGGRGNAQWGHGQFVCKVTNPLHRGDTITLVDADTLCMLPAQGGGCVMNIAGFTGLIGNFENTGGLLNQSEIPERTYYPVSLLVVYVARNMLTAFGPSLTLNPTVPALDWMSFTSDQQVNNLFAAVLSGTEPIEIPSGQIFGTTSTFSTNSYATYPIDVVSYRMRVDQ